MPLNITTAIDSLVDLVKTKKRIPLEDAAKELGLPSSIVNEWASFLEEEGILEIEYKFTTPYLVIKEKEESVESTEDLRRRLDLATRHLQVILTKLSKYQIDHKAEIENVEDIRKLIKLNPTKLTKEVLYAQKFVLIYEANELLKLINKIRLLTPELMKEVEKRIDNLDGRREIFEKNYNKIK